MKRSPSMEMAPDGTVGEARGQWGLDVLPWLVAGLVVSLVALTLLFWWIAA